MDIYLSLKKSSLISSIPTKNCFGFSEALNTKLDHFLTKFQDDATWREIVEIWAGGKKTHKLM